MRFVTKRVSPSPLAPFSFHRDIGEKGSDVLYAVDPIDEYAVQQSPWQ